MSLFPLAAIVVCGRGLADRRLLFLVVHVLLEVAVDGQQQRALLRLGPAALPLGIGVAVGDQFIAALGEALAGQRPLRAALNQCRPLTDADLEGILESHGISTDDFQGPQVRPFGAR